MQIDIVTLGAAKIDPETGAVLVQAAQPVGSDDTGDVESYGEVPMLQALGLTSVPYPSTDGGYCEGIVIGGVGGSDGCVAGARDTRTASIAGNAKPGDTILHTTGPNQSAQLQLKEDKRQAVLVTKKSNGEQMLLSLDGNREEMTIAINGAVFQIDKDGGIAIVDSTGKAGLTISNGVVNLFGQLVLGGMTPNPALSIMLGPVTGSPGGGAAAPMVAAPGVFIGQ
jgi:hypothetical protein